MSLVALTVDTEFPDQPAADDLGTADEVLAVLSRHGVKATFFIVGAWARAYPERVRSIREQGHQIGNHSYSHCSLTRMTETGIADDLAACDRVLSELGIETRPWFRAPYGELGDEPAGVKRAIEQAGYRHVHWDADGEDWRPGKTAEQVAEATIAQVRARWPRPAVALFHSWPDPAPHSLELVLGQLLSEGAKFVTLEQIGRRDIAIGRLRGAVGRAF